MRPSPKKERKGNIHLPGESISVEQFKEEIAKAEKGPFYSIEKSKKIISKWRKQSDLK